MAPTVHANFRFLGKGERSWFGGGADLTPYYPYREDAIHFHRVWRSVRTRHEPLVNYAHMKKWRDDYFFLPHRGEARGGGGIFFDYLEGNFDALFTFVRDCGDHFPESYLPIVQRRKDEPCSEEQRAFQEYHGQRLTRALQDANELAWRALELSLAGESLWERCKIAAARAEDKAFARQVRAFLDAAALPEPAMDSVFRPKCLQELRAARKAGLLSQGTLHPRELAEQQSHYV